MLTRIVYIVVDTRRLTLYKEDGESITIPQGDPRVPVILRDAIPVIKAGKVAEIDLEDRGPTGYQSFEEQSNGLVRFFQVARSKLSRLFGNQGQESDGSDLSASIGCYGTLTDAIHDILTNSKPARSEAIPGHETVVAVVTGDDAQTRLVPDAHQVQAHIKHSVRLGSTVGMENFFKRIAAVIDQRQHSVEDLLRFMERGDLPVADDGSIIVYKILKESNNHFVDCHTRKVKQRIGSKVVVSEALVDKDRRNECSQGLHVARRAYLRNFVGDVCVLAKVAPEDVITVPHNDPDKVRVCAYHILGKLSFEAYRTLLENKPITHLEQDQTLLAQAISGNHIGVLELVHITKPMGGGLTIIPTELGKQTQQATTETPVTQRALAQAIAIDDERVRDQATRPVKPAEINQTIAKTYKGTKKETVPVQAPATATISRKEQARLYTNILMSTMSDRAHMLAAAQRLADFKKAQKVSWDKLGVTEAQRTVMNMLLAEQPKTPKVKVSAKTKALSEKMKSGEAISESKPAPSNDNRKAARNEAILKLHDEGNSVNRISKLTGVHRRSVDRIIAKFR